MPPALTVVRPYLRFNTEKWAANTAQPRGTRKAATPRRPVCTHMMMHRQYGASQCCMCGRRPDIGFLYVCHQDSELQRAHAAVLNDAQSTTLEPSEEGGCFHTMAGLARSLGMSRSVVAGIEAGNYTFDQVDILIAQKEHLNATIRKSEEDQPTPTLKSVLDRHDPEPNGLRPLPTAPPGLPPSGTTSALPTDGNNESKHLRQNEPQGCGVRVCHTCRPQFYDRYTVNIESILLAEIPAVTSDEMNGLHMLDADILRNLDFQRPSIQPLSRDHRQRSFESQIHTDESSEWTPSRTNTDESSNDGDDDPNAGNNCYALSTLPSQELVFDDRMRGLDGSAAYGLGMQSRMTPALSNDDGDAFDTPGRTSSTASSISLPIPDRNDSLSNVNKLPRDSPKAATLCDSDFRKDNPSIYLTGADGSYDSLAVEIGGGPALTEEAIDHGMPDIITSV